MNKKLMFFRDDDVREFIEPELIKLVEIFTEAQVPISLAIEPANVTEEVVNWLLEKKKAYPDLIELIQHGYDHNKNSLYPEGTEFGMDRTFDDQYADIEKGKFLMTHYFKDKWFPAMAFPYGSYNTAALQALDKLQFSVVSTGVTFSFPHQLKDLLGRILKKDSILGKKVSHHNRIRKPYKLVELNCSINIIKKYISEYEAEHFSFEEMVQNIQDVSKYSSVIGILFHHRFHTQQFETIDKLLHWIKKNDVYELCSMKKIYTGF